MTRFEKFDASKYLDTEEAIAEFLAAALEDENARLRAALSGETT